MKSSEIFRNAARLCERDCSDNWLDAVAYAQLGVWPTRKLVRKMNFVGADNSRAYETSDHRIVSLCLAAAIAESEGD